MRISDFQFYLPEELIAQSPLEPRDASRMLAVHRSSGVKRDLRFKDFPSLLRESDLIVLNDTKVFPARLIGETATGARIEVFLVEEGADGSWIVLARPGKRLAPGKVIRFDERLSGEVVEKLEDGKVRVRFDAAGDLLDIVQEIGRTPLPPYIKRAEEIDSDRDRYQTVYAKSRGAIAAPTAGLHFTPETFAVIEEMGAQVCTVTLHVGYGTFEPVRVEELADHRVSAERFEISPDAAEQLNRARCDGRRIVAIGTTTTRALESALGNRDSFASGMDVANLTITPGFKFRAVGAMLTNFHLPQSSLLVLVSTFAGHALIMSAYREAVEKRYRFYSYGDCMFIE